MLHCEGGGAEDQDKQEKQDEEGKYDQELEGKEERQTFRFAPRRFASCRSLPERLQFSRSAPA